MNECPYSLNESYIHLIPEARVFIQIIQGVFFTEKKFSSNLAESIQNMKSPVRMTRKSEHARNRRYVFAELSILKCIIQVNPHITLVAPSKVFDVKGDTEVFSRKRIVLIRNSYRNISSLWMFCLNKLTTDQLLSARHLVVGIIMNLNMEERVWSRRIRRQCKRTNNNWIHFNSRIDWHLLKNALMVYNTWMRRVISGCDLLRE